MRDSEPTQHNNMRPILKQSSSTTFSVDSQRYSTDQSVNEGADKSDHRRVTFSPFAKRSHRRKSHPYNGIPSQEKPSATGKSRIRSSRGRNRTFPAQRRDADSVEENAPKEEWNERVMVMNMLYEFAQMHSKSTKERLCDTINKYTCILPVLEWLRVHGNLMMQSTKREAKALISGSRRSALPRSIHKRQRLSTIDENPINFKNTTAFSIDRPLWLKKPHEGSFKAFVNSAKQTLSLQDANDTTSGSSSASDPPFDRLPGVRSVQSRIARFDVSFVSFSLVLATRPQQTNADYALLFSHGNAEDLGLIYDWFFEISQRLCINVIAYDYSGYGRSEGIASEEACYADIEAAYLYLRDVKKIPSHKIILYGRSLGSGPTTHLAAELSRSKKIVAGVILQSPVLSMYRVVFQFRFSMPGDLFCNIDRIADIESPITIIHGTRDEVVPFWHAEILFENCQQEWRFKPLWVTDAGHNNIEVFLSACGDQFFEHLIEFVTICHTTTAIRMEDSKLSDSVPPLPSSSSSVASFNQ
uniref:Serine protease family S09X putative n=1 Tax=Albugo laibachii Nc14 TaxID=890382 RepID=F0WMG7_9STRA|nr:serine protease family S09X putative [Albugo laibachii Nc14]|eukprot:CCA22499.1 serine protease family S09X putative [Albugo laibachii Nc14]